MGNCTKTNSVVEREKAWGRWGKAQEGEEGREIGEEEMGCRGKGNLWRHMSTTHINHNVWIIIG